MSSIWYGKVLNVDERVFMDAMGVCFVSFVGQYGYDRVLSVLGRHMRDFLNGLDNLHEYLKFSYPRMKAPSFICENETKQGLTLHYRSKRRGFVYYTMGQIREVIQLFSDNTNWYIAAVHVYASRLCKKLRSIIANFFYLPRVTWKWQVARHFYHKEMVGRKNLCLTSVIQ